MTTLTISEDYHDYIRRRRRALIQTNIYRWLEEMRNAALRFDIVATEIAAREIWFLAEEYWK